MEDHLLAPILKNSFQESFVSCTIKKLITKAKAQKNNLFTQKKTEKG
jgi:hypothetical protein